MSDVRDRAFTLLVKKSEVKGFITFEDISDIAADCNLEIQDIDRLSSDILDYGIILREKDDLEKKEESSFLYFDDNLIYCKITEKEPVLTSMVNYVRKISPPQRNEVERLYPQIENGNLYARNRLFEMYMRNVLKFAYQQSLEFNLNLADTIQDGMMGLHIAVDKYSPYVHGKFPAYSYFWIKSTIDVHKKIENSLWDIPNNKLIDVENLYKYLKKYIPSCFENPQLTDTFVKEIADKQQLPLEDAERYLVLLTHPININFVEVERHDNGFYKLWLKNVVKKIFATLGEKDSALAEMYYCSSLTYSEIAEKLDVSRERIRQKFIKIDQKVKKEGSRYFDIDPRITEFNF